MFWSSKLRFVTRCGTVEPPAAQLELSFLSHHPAPETLSPEVCSPVPVKERLPCAPSPLSRGDCDQLGCCYSSEEEEAGSCYYGNTGTCFHLKLVEEKGLSDFW